MLLQLQCARANPLPEAASHHACSRLLQAQDSTPCQAQAATHAWSQASQLTPAPMLLLQTQRAKAIPLPKGVELQQAGYNFRDNANLLANMELGVHREDYERERETTDLDKDSEGTPGAQVGSTDGGLLKTTPWTLNPSADWGLLIVSNFTWFEACRGPAWELHASCEAAGLDRQPRGGRRWGREGAQGPLGGCPSAGSQLETSILLIVLVCGWGFC